VLRRFTAAAAPEQSGQRIEFEGWVFDLNRRELTRRDTSKPVDLTTSEFNLLEAFVKRAHRVLSRDEIMDLLKGHDWSPLDRSIDNLIARLRKKIEPDPDRPRLIKTIRGVGYTFAVEARREVDCPFSLFGIASSVG
jgi:DNA-binding response OmpR family regulator